MPGLRRRTACLHLVAMTMRGLSDDYSDGALGVQAEDCWTDLL
jgi:hypothetical protein